MVRLREGLPSDLDAMYELDVLCFEPLFRFSRRTMRQLTRAAGAFTLVADAASGSLAGFLVVHLTRRRGETEGYLVTLDVAPDQRRQGLAQLLVDGAEKKAIEGGASSMALHVWVENLSAIRFYEAAGYTRTMLDTDFYGEGVSAYGYHKVLAAEE